MKKCLGCSVPQFPYFEHKELTKEGSQKICHFIPSVLLELKRERKNYELIILGKYDSSGLSLPCFSTLRLAVISLLIA